MHDRILLLISLMALSLGTLACTGGSDGTGLPVTTVTVSGTVMYEDREYDESGFTFFSEPSPVRQAMVEVVAEATQGVLASSVTNSTGGYRVVFDAIAGTRAYVRVLADTSGSPGVPPVTVVSPLSDSAIHSFAGPSFNVDEGPITSDIIMDSSSPAGGAFNILDVMTAAGLFVNSLQGDFPPPVTARWTQGYTDWYYGTSFSGGNIWVSGSVSDTDEYDDDVLWHEYGHFAADAFSKDDSPGGPHDFLTNDLDLRLSWSEGWGGYFQGALKRWLSLDPVLSGVLSLAPGTPLTQYVDTDSGGTYNSKDMADPGGSPYMFSSNEVAVAKVLLDLEGAPEYGPQPVWDIFNSIHSYLLPLEQVTLEAFWDGWVTMEGRSVIANTAIANRLVFYQEDSWESLGDDTPNASRLAVVNGAGEEHYLYSESSPWDTDYIAFEAVSPGSYKIETLCMRNGADTYLRLMGSDGAVLPGLSSNDDTPVVPICSASPYPFAYQFFSSRVIYNIDTPGIYYAEVTASGSPKTTYAGRYGTYTLIINGP